MFYVEMQTILQAQRAQDPPREKSSLVGQWKSPLNINGIQWDQDPALLLTYDHLAEKSDNCTSLGKMKANDTN